MFQACVAVNVEIGDMFLRITQNENLFRFVPALVALRCADKRQFARVTCCFPFFVALQRRHDISRIGSSEKVIRTVSHTFLSLVAERWVPGSVNS